MNPLELPKERLATTDAQGRRVFLYPEQSKGRFSRLRFLVRIILIAILLVGPWLRWNGKPLLLLDIAHRHFFIFGMDFRAHDAPLIFFLFLSFSLGIAFVTAIWGRVWCGWACPQTVFIEGIFRPLERLAEGSHRSQRQLDEAPWDSNKLAKKSLKWTLYLLATGLITHSFLAYFVGSEKVLEMVTRPPAENPISFLVVLTTTLILLFDLAWFREQFCVIMCPYGRLQSVLMDRNSLVVAYDQKRGEPRRGENILPQGDCVNCYKCVQVCPTGIDIRRGTQMECIACTSCIDACDTVMAKLRKPLGLIRYTTEAQLEGKQKNWLGLRTFIYLGLLSISLGIFVLTLSLREPISFTVLRAPGNPYESLQTAGSTEIVNHFRLELVNQDHADKYLEFSIDDSLQQDGFRLIMPQNKINLVSSESKRLDFFIKFPKSQIPLGSKTISIKATGKEYLYPLELRLLGPFQ